MQEIIAHRGASAHAAEHTLAAYDLAVAQGADVLELDVRETADGRLVVVHDETLLRTAGDPRRVDSVDSAALAALDPDVRPLTLATVLVRYRRNARFLLDLKEPAPEWEGRLLATISRTCVRDRVVVQSFDHAALRRLRAAAPWLNLAALTRTRPLDLAALAAFAHGVGPWHESVDAAFVTAAHANGLAVRPWTVNDPVAIAHLISLGVDGVITD
ncbi:MAG TPA: glycerophosphodiester phosphodiesterase, partial [Solirubrobacteraceae bacterium]|nr:glycerophosphodiester phosphodiesterase [Solirubrobacteraceae bacterium]